MMQTAEGEMLNHALGALQVIRKAAPAGGEVGYAPGCEWFVPAQGQTTYTTGTMYVNVGNNGLYYQGVQNPTALWVEVDPSSGQQFQFGTGSGLMLGEGTLYRNVFGAGSPPASTGADIVIDVYSLPGNSLDGISNRGLAIQAGGNITGSDASTAKIIFGPSAAVIGSAVTGGTTIATTGSMSQASKGWYLATQVWKYGAANSDTQIYQETATVVAATHGGVGVAGTLTMDEEDPILIAVTINVTTTAADCTLWWWQVSGIN